MPQQTDTLAQVLFNKPSLCDCSLEQVEYLAHQYPFFSVAQLLYSKKINSASALYAETIQRTALHFSNPLQAEYWLKQDSTESELFQNPIIEKTAEPIIESVTETEKIIEPVEVERNIVLPAPIENSEPVIELSEYKTEEKTASEEPLPIAFEPFHTVDYFASQGIKLSQQEAVNDALGKQVKSFTEWLKTMKRLPETTPQKTTIGNGERNVENLAAHSLDSAEVFTESMAEVWLKQGKPEKAAEVYAKLGLIYPAKSAYFAAKIKSLKID